MRRRRWRVVVLALAGLYFLVPLLSAAEFSLRTPGGGYGVANYLAVVRDEALYSALLVSLEIAVLTAVLVLLLVVPTAVWVRLRFPAAAGLLESATILPIVVPPVVMAAGIAFVQATGAWTVFRTLFASSVSEPPRSTWCSPASPIARWKRPGRQSAAQHWSRTAHLARGCHGALGVCAAPRAVIGRVPHHRLVLGGS